MFGGVGFDHYIINFELIFKINLTFISQISIGKCFCKMFNNVFTCFKIFTRIILFDYQLTASNDIL